jgi:hypothetical protein
LVRGRANNPNFALFFRNGDGLGNATPKLYWPVQVDGETVLIEAFGIDRLAAGKQLVGFHLHRDTGRPWVWENNRSPENVPLSELPQIDGEQWDALWREIAHAGATLGFVEKNAGGTKSTASAGATGPAGGARAGVDMKAIVDLLAAHWPTEGSRHDVARALGGFFCRAGFSETEIGEVVEQVALAAGDEDGDDRVKAAKSAVSARAQGKNIAGKPRIAELLGDEVAEKLCELCKYHGRPGYVSYGSFTMDAEHGLTKEIVKTLGKTATIETVRISASFEVLGACRDPHGRAWGKLVRFHDADNRVHMRHISDAALQGDPATLCAALADEGLKINRSRQKEFAEYLSGVVISTRVTIVNSTGWHEVEERHVFALPSETIGASDDIRVVIDAAALGPYEARGSLDDWTRGVGTLTAGHVLPVFMVSAALAGPLAHLSVPRVAASTCSAPPPSANRRCCRQRRQCGGAAARRAICGHGERQRMAWRGLPRAPPTPALLSTRLGLATPKRSHLPSIRWRTDRARRAPGATVRCVSRSLGGCQSSPVARFPSKPSWAKIAGVRRALVSLSAWWTFPPIAGSASARLIMRAVSMTPAS